MNDLETPTPSPGGDAAAALDELAATLRTAASAYYETDAQTMTDAEYDDGIERLRIAAVDHPTLAERFDDLLGSVAAGQSAGGDVTHTSLMGSMEKVVGLEAVGEFVTTLGGPVVVEPKLDGLALTVTYRDGVLAVAATRGDGRSGEDITDRIRRLEISGLPEQLAGESAGVLEVRGEVFVTEAAFERANELRLASSAKATAFVNPRNAAAGILRKGDPAFAGVPTFAAYEVLPDPAVAEVAETTHGQRIALVESLGIGTVHQLVDALSAEPTTDVDEVLARVQLLGDGRATLGFPIDGAVVKADDDEDRRAAGYGSRAPKWAVAYKYEAENATTTVRAITTAVGRTGRLAVRVEVEPVFVGGTTITFASGHNVGWMLERDVRVGDTITVRRAGDVIPYIADVDLEARPDDSEPWAPPENDPVGNPWDKSTLLWRSTSPELSVLGRVVYAASRDCFDIEGIGTEIATTLVERGMVSTVADLFTLELEQLEGLDLGGRALGAANAGKIFAEIERARSTPWNRVITALGIRATGRTMGRRLAAAFPTMDRLRAASVDALADVGGIGPIKAELMYQGLRELEAIGVLDALEAAGVNMGTEPEPGDEADALPLSGMRVVVSGSVPGLTRGEIAEVIEANGGTASSSVSTTTTLLVSEPSTSSKYTKATDLGVRIITPAEFIVLLAGAPTAEASEDSSPAEDVADEDVTASPAPSTSPEP
ncbi:NAD-dependent DNA ligase LigA [Sanguibacter antarcticus]|uniref:DNA ligase n=1 Tax=Sanguibacter antarcticus TaxID=372484 RepID=A0A2A9E914_9MICO|nr:NAD-dependent DNA ligase LigA [Sanguibacter antarcticus]PFG34670.1 DNA ligase (NAD+) [Sanguibacter antarcticus]